MELLFCPRCGSAAARRRIGDEGEMNYCDHCQRPLWNLFPVCVIVAVFNEYGEVALLRQDYVTKRHHVLVAGYIKEGETAEEAARREVKEELGLVVESLSYERSFFHEQNSMLMIGFAARAKKAPFELSGEVDAASWVSAETAAQLLRDGSIAQELLESAQEEQKS